MAAVAWFAPLIVILLSLPSAIITFAFGRKIFSICAAAPEIVGRCPIIPTCWSIRRQWQKFAIARAFYSDSDVLILDEPTASLDAIAEQEIFNQFERLRKDKIAFFVSHRLSSATTAAKILVLDNGQLAECGNHKELMEKKGTYYRLFSTQASRYQA